jgi:peptidoglycan/xylan/chitin deacetylase (PgdA/CDA1 family)
LKDAITLALGAKGRFGFLGRMKMIAQRYGLTPSKMETALDMFCDVLQRFGCGASFPVTAVALERSPDVLHKYCGRGIEFIVHGYRHIDYTQLPFHLQLAEFQRARAIFESAGITTLGYRSPYLRQGDGLNKALAEAGFSYISNQPVLWNVLDDAVLGSAIIQTNYAHALAFYDPWNMDQRVSLPYFVEQLVEIPVSLPDDEVLLDRLHGDSALLAKIWGQILNRTYQRHELFTLQLHPERIRWAADGLASVLRDARALTPAVWLARLGEIAGWWREYTAVEVYVDTVDVGVFDVKVVGSQRVTILARAVAVEAPTVTWMDGYRQIEATSFQVRAACRPFIGVSPDTPSEVRTFLSQQGYIVEISAKSTGYAYHIDRAEFTAEQGRKLLDDIESSGCALVRLSCWPEGFASALAVTGDIDALTLLDYGLRVFGH